MINAPADLIWQVISNFKTADMYLNGVIHCAIEGEGVGARRTLTNADGGTILERLEMLDAEAQQLTYALLTDTPFSNCLTTMSVRNLGPHQAQLTWSATFDAVGLPSSEAAELMESALAANCVALKQYIEL
jgi:carbon monoxide dehydrogenase subunit G